MNNTLPTDDLKKYGIIDSDNSFTKKLSPDDIQKFLQGQTLLAENDKNRISFQLIENNSKLNVNFYERDIDLSAILKNTKDEIQYSNIFSKYNINADENAAQLGWSKSVFVLDNINNRIVEYDMLRKSSELTELILGRNNPEETGIYKNELLKLKELLQQKVEQYPEIAKEITNQINIVSKEINSVNSISPSDQQISKESKNDIDLNVNDRDLYEDANRNRDEDQQQEEDLELDRSRRRGR